MKSYLLIGTQTQNIQCFDVIGNRLVHDEHCSKIPKPSTKERMCRVECFYKFLKVRFKENKICSLAMRNFFSMVKTHLMAIPSRQFVFGLGQTVIKLMNQLMRPNAFQSV